MLRRIILLFPAAALICFGQLDTGTVVGTVLDSSGSVIPGASVSVENQNTGAAFTAKTNDVGVVLSFGWSY